MSYPSPNLPTTTANSAKRKPRVSLAIATAFGLGYLPKAPGTFGSLGGLLLATFPYWYSRLAALLHSETLAYVAFPVDVFVYLQCLLALGVAATGVFTAHRAAKYWSIKDPQRVVIDEVSGQQIALLLGGFWPLHASPVNSSIHYPSADHPILWATHPLGFGMVFAPNWKYLLLGFILFRVFDIWKPFPARQAESLPGGLGIMADDWIAGIYAALGLWIARALGL
jgi:phosphatidylglycerophosphatase A